MTDAPNPAHAVEREMRDQPRVASRAVAAELTERRPHETVVLVLDVTVAGFTSDEIRAAEAPVLAAVREGALMDHAAAGLAIACTDALRAVRGAVSGGRVVLVVGSGNNGGDALLAGARLASRGVLVHAILLTETVHERGLARLLSAGGRHLRIGVPGSRQASTRPAGDWAALVHAADVVVDGLSGLSGRPGLPALAGEIFERVSPRALTVAVDVPSGVDVDTGETPSAHVDADKTVTFGAMKPCLLVPPAAYAAGEVTFVDVGLGDHLPPRAMIERLPPSRIGPLWPVPKRRDHKYRRGVLGVVAGSDAYPGAAVLACSGAVRAGVGIVRYIGPDGSTEQVIAARPEVVPGIGQVQAWLLGSGVEDDPSQDEAIDVALRSGLPCVVDAGALTRFVGARLTGLVPASAEQVLLTPHAGELTRILNILGESATDGPVAREDVESRPLHFARLAARELDVTVLLKGSVTLVASPDGHVFSQDDGPPWLATAGSGDVLAGIAGALLAAGVPASLAGAMSASVHGMAGERVSGGGPITTLDTCAVLPSLIAELIRDGQHSAGPRISHRGPEQPMTAAGVRQWSIRR
ncbi:MAG: bifunctional ADP-dependent NAD(P)H-hydrate dehydratase/NAD(P)H-hydrate epimerase [Nocardioides sp.]